MNRRRIRWELLILVAVILLLTVPFLNQAYHLDDREFIEFGRAQLEDPFQFYLTDYDYAGRHFEVFHTSHPPLLSSLIASTIRVSGGESEPWLHGVYLIFPLLAGIAMYSLGRRFTGRALVSSLLLVTTTGFLVMSHTIRGDVPGVAMWLASIASYVWGVDRSDRRILALSAFFLSLAVMTSYQCLSLVPLLFLYALLQRRISLATMMPLIAPLALFAVYVAYFYNTTGEFIRFSYRTSPEFSWLSLPIKGRALIIFLGAATVFPLSIIAAIVRSKTDILLTAILFVPAAIMGIVIPFALGDIDGLQAFLMLIFMAAGISVFYVAGRGIVAWLSRWRSPDGPTIDALFLSVWFAGVAFYIFSFLPYIAVRYMLPLFPPVILLFVRCAEQLLKKHPLRQTGFLYGTVVLTLALALPAAVADYRLANTYRTLADNYQKEFGDTAEKVWFQGEFGFRYYMEKAGFDYLGVSAVAESGDLVISSLGSFTTGPDLMLAPVPEEFSVVTGKTTIEDDFPFRIRNSGAMAGFYSHRIGPVPVMLSREPLDEITFYRLQW
ncbi:MAG: glycosyltransferase family 39 protein [Thermoleophilia bacterium]|nr:glycosyltransferase family 39 protein [Thermoleophilia bacterium]